MRRRGRGGCGTIGWEHCEQMEPSRQCILELKPDSSPTLMDIDWPPMWDVDRMVKQSGDGSRRTGSGGILGCSSGDAE